MGPRSADYFQQIFLGGGGARMQLAEHCTATSEIDLAEGYLLDAVPVLLTFIYTGILAVTTENATALLNLARYLRAKAASTQTLAFV